MYEIFLNVRKTYIPVPFTISTRRVESAIKLQVPWGAFIRGLLKYLPYNHLNDLTVEGYGHCLCLTDYKHTAICSVLWQTRRNLKGSPFTNTENGVWISNNIHSFLWDVATPTWYSGNIAAFEIGVWMRVITCHSFVNVVAYPDSKVHGANIGPIWGRQDPSGPHVGSMNFATSVSLPQTRYWLSYSLLIEETQVSIDIISISK